jgi:hypothetical protein
MYGKDGHGLSPSDSMAAASTKLSGTFGGGERDGRLCRMSAAQIENTADGSAAACNSSGASCSRCKPLASHGQSEKSEDRPWQINAGSAAGASSARKHRVCAYKCSSLQINFSGGRQKAAHMQHVAYWQESNFDKASSSSNSE